MKKTEIIPTEKVMVTAQVFELAQLGFAPSYRQTLEIVQSLAREHAAILAPTLGLPAILADLGRQAQDARLDFLKVSPALMDLARSVRCEGLPLDAATRSLCAAARSLASAILQAQDTPLASEAIN
jgi:hypothetical protein